MCMFCAAMPAAIAVGTNLHAKQRREQRAAEARGEEPKRRMPVMPLTGLTLVVLAFLSVFYHSQSSG